MDILILNGPNLNLLGQREPDIYGNIRFESFFSQLQTLYKNNVRLAYYQNNIEGELINKLHDIGFSYFGIIFNPGAYAHTSLALADAISAISTPVIEVHISNIFARETFRHHSYLSSVCKGCISGFGLKSYTLAMEYFISCTDLKQPSL